MTDQPIIDLTVAGNDRSIEYYFASDARYEHFSLMKFSITLMTLERKKEYRAFQLLCGIGYYPETVSEARYFSYND